MFQNISESTEDNFDKDVRIESNEKRESLFKRTFTIQNCIIYVLSFLVSMAGGDSNILTIAPFSYSMIAASIGTKIPALMVCVSCLAGSIIKNGTSYLLYDIFTIILFFSFVLIKRPKESDMEIESNEQIKVGIHMSLAVFIVQMVPLIFGTFYLYDFLYAIILTLLTYVMYKIFVNSLPVFRIVGIKKAFTAEEVIGASLIAIIAISSFGSLSVFGFSLRNILSILVILILGWQNGMLVGATGGIIIGLTLGILQGEDISFIATYAISGLIASVLNKLGKIGVIVGFVLGTIILTYLSNGHISNIIRYQEVLIASLGLLTMPKVTRLKVSDLIEKNLLLPETTGRTLEENKETADKLNNISSTISELAKEYGEAAATVVCEDEKVENKESIKDSFEKELKIHLEGQEENLLFDDIYYNNDSILEDIFNMLNKKDIVNRKDIIDIFANHNNYIIGVTDKEDEDYELKADLDDMIKAINSSYRLAKMNQLLNKKVKQNRKTVSQGLTGISEILSNMAEELTINKEDEFIEKNKEIKELLNEKEINVKDITIKKEENEKYVINLYTSICQSVDGKQCYSKKIEKILSKVFNENMILQKQKCGLREKENSCVFVYTSQDKYVMQVGIAKTKKADSIISGDTTTQTRLGDGKYLLALSDGMGSGPDARKSSKIAIKTLERLLETGFDNETALKLINSIIAGNSDEDMYATLDVSIVDLYNGNMKFFKNGACPTFIKRNGQVEILKAISLPTGILDNIDLVEYNYELKDDDIIVMCSDGVLDSSKDFTNKELWIKYLLEDLETDDAQRISDIILNEARDNDYGKEKDDMSVIAFKINTK